MSRLNELVANHVMDLPRDKALEQHRALIEADVASLLRARPGLKREDIRSSPFRWPPAYDQERASYFFVVGRHAVEKRMDELGLRDAYVQALTELVAPGLQPSEAIWALLDVTNEQRCLAALRVMGHEL